MDKKLHKILNKFLNEEISSNEVLDAIHNQYQVRIKYDDGGVNGAGNPKGSRVIKPFAIGTTKKGYPVLRAFQEGGGSRRGAPKWKFFRLDRITSWKPMRNKRFFDTPPSEYGEYNRTGDKTMGTFLDNVKFNNFISPLEKQRAQFGNDVKIGQQKQNQQGPIQPRITQQWKKNVYTSQPNSKKYADIRKNIENTPKKDDDFWKLFDLNDAEQEMTKQGPIIDNSYDVDDINFNENDYINNNKK